MPLFQNLQSLFVGYGVYHSNPINKVIHIICIPLILETALQILLHYSFHYNTALLEININIVATAILCFLYLWVHLQTGFVTTLFYGTLSVIGNNFYQFYVDNNQTQEHLRMMIQIHIICWILQFIGHGVFEKRAPALLDNIFQVFAAPNFVIIEILFLCGFFKDLNKSCEDQIKKLVSNYQNEKKKK